ncbi:MAG: TolC family protein [Oligoflexia bacterium]|nr:TolC family protein [Oligoflexia bacterium]
MKYPITLLTLSILLAPLKAELVSLDENKIIELSKTKTPTSQQIEQGYLASQVQLSQFDDQFNLEATGEGSYYRTNEKQFSQFAPVTSPVRNVSLGVTRAFRQGLALNVGAFSEQFSNSFVNKGTTAGVSAQVSLDLWKNFLGRSANKKYESLKNSSERAKFESSINKKAFTQNLRKLYWSLVANNEALVITEKLLVSSKKQVEQAQRRFREKIADSGEVARYKSQVASRSAQIVSLKYQRENLIQSLKELIPELSDKDIKLGTYNVEQQVQKVLACTGTIAQNQAPPMENTFYDEVLSLVKKERDNELKVSNLYNHADVKLISEVKYFGKDLGSSETFDDFQDNKQRSYSVGLSFNIPIEGKKRTTKEILEKMNHKKYGAMEDETLSKIQAYHGQIIKTVSLLREIVKNQQENTYHLSQSLKTSQRKFNQARLSVQQLVQEQDAYLQSNLDEIQTKLNVIHTLLDYLSVFTETNCEMNRI